jgi:hypothetical protein
MKVKQQKKDLQQYKKANDLELKTTEDVLKMQRRKIEVQKATMALSENMAEDLDELASLEVELIDLQTASFQTQKRLATEMETLTNEIAAKEKAAQKVIDDEKAEKEKERIASEKINLEAKTNWNLERIKDETDEEFKIRIAAAEKLADEKKRIEAATVLMQNEMANQGLQILASAAGEGTALAKAAAIAQATISGVQGVQNAFTSANANIGATAGSFGIYPVTNGSSCRNFCCYEYS